MKNPLTYYNSLKDNQHVFIYCVAGRSSSTALQRIINSSNKIWIWGERKGIIEHTLSLIDRMRLIGDSDVVKESLSKMYMSYETNQHDHFYPNAIGNIHSTIALLNASIANQLKPWAPRVKRFGFKDININDIRTLKHLREIFPNCFFLFGFRNPCIQWNSVKTVQWWEYSKDLRLFLKEYERISSVYMDFSGKHNVGAFVESDDLWNWGKLKLLLRYINISEIDLNLLTKKVSTVADNEIMSEEIFTIQNSSAYQNYLTMKSLSESLYIE